jgi:hypothetical protein
MPADVNYVRWRRGLARIPAPTADRDFSADADVRFDDEQRTSIQNFREPSAGWLRCGSCRRLGELCARKLHKQLHTHRTVDEEQVALNEKAPRAALLQSPLTDSNRRPPPYHMVVHASNGSRRQRLWLV